MPLLALGMNHTTAPVAVREQVIFAPDTVPAALRSLRDGEQVTEAVILSTCNRTDLYCELRKANSEPVAEWFRRYHGFPAQQLNQHIYTHHGDGAVRHMMRVASGLDSMVLGEPQILGQIKSAYQVASASGTVGTTLARLFQTSFSVAKQVRTNTAIGASPVSVAFAAVSLAKQIFGPLHKHTALLIGAGETIALTARHLHSNGLQRMIIANRTEAHAHRLASEFDAHAIGLHKIPAYLAQADIIISSTGSSEVIVGLNDVREAIKLRKHRPIFIADIAVPHDIDPAIGTLEDIYLYTVDDLEGVIQENMHSRQEAALQAESIIEAEVSDFMRWLGTRGATPTIVALRRNAELTRDELLIQAEAMLVNGKPPQQVLRFLANTLTNKLIHPPTVELRRAGADARVDIIDVARMLYRIDEVLDADDETS